MHADEKIMRQEKIGILIRITKTPQLDNMKILKELLYPSEELVIGTTKKKVNFLSNDTPLIHYLIKLKI